MLQKKKLIVGMLNGFQQDILDLWPEAPSGGKFIDINKLTFYGENGCNCPPFSKKCEDTHRK